MKLEVDEFIRRFLLHLLPKGFFKVRYYGIFSSRYRKENIETARELLAAESANADKEAIEDGLRVLQKQDTVWDEISQSIKNYKKPNCTRYAKGGDSVSRALCTTIATCKSNLVNLVRSPLRSLICEIKTQLGVVKQHLIDQKRQ